MALETAPDPLPCGRDPLELVDQFRRGRSDPHSRSCAYCRAAIATDIQTAAFTQYLKDLPVRAPDTLLPSVMKRVWTELRPGRTIPIESEQGPAFATEQAITTLLIDALDQLPDIIVHTCRLRLMDPADAESHETDIGARREVQSAGEPDQSMQIQIQAAAAFSVDLHELGGVTRSAVAAALMSQFGLRADAIDIDFVDVYLQDAIAQ